MPRALCPEMARACDEGLRPRAGDLVHHRAGFDFGFGLRGVGLGDQTTPHAY